MARRKALPLIPVNEATSKSPDELPARVIYSLRRDALVPAPGLDPDMPTPEFKLVAKQPGKLANGLTYRADAMARMVARGVPATEALRSIYPVRPGLAPKYVAERAFRITRSETFDRVLTGYREELREQGAQAIVSIRQFVMSRLVQEAQDAKADASRVRSLELLGKTEGMFTDVKRVEHIQDGRIDELKQRLSARLEQIMTRFAPMSPSHGDDIATIQPQPHPPSTPLISSGSHPEKLHMNPLSHPPISGAPIPEMTLEDLGVGGATTNFGAPVSREMEPGDLGL